MEVASGWGQGFDALVGCARSQYKFTGDKGIGGRGNKGHRD